MEDSIISKEGKTLLFLFIFFTHTVFALEEKNISVRIKMSSAKTVKVSGSNLKRRFILTGEVKQFTGNKSISFYCDKFLQRNKISKDPFLIASISSKSNVLVINKHRYEGVAYLLANPTKRNCDIILKTGFEGYLSSVLAKEMNAKWPLEALKAQAIAARTYALFKMKKNVNQPFDMEGSEKDQVIGHILDKTHKTDRAVLETSGMVLLNKQNKIIPAFFHAECGGRLVKPGEVWDNHIKGFSHKASIFCRKRKNRYTWKYSLPNSKFFKFLRWLRKKGRISFSGNLKKVKIRNDSYSSSVLYIKTKNNDIRIKKTWLRNYLGRFKINSTNYRFKLGKNRIYFNGRGRGHGVGLCQLGALKMAKSGYNYKQILKYYFSGFKISDINKKN